MPGSLPVHFEDGFAFDWGVAATSATGAATAIATKLDVVDGCMASLTEGTASKATCSFITAKPHTTVGSIVVQTWEQDGTAATAAGQCTWMAFGKAHSHATAPTAGTYA